LSGKILGLIWGLRWAFLQGFLKKGVCLTWYFAWQNVVLCVVDVVPKNVIWARSKM
jgi:hypothetical protein